MHGIAFEHGYLALGTLCQREHRFVDEISPTSQENGRLQIYTDRHQLFSTKHEEPKNGQGYESIHHKYDGPGALQ